MIHCTNVVGKHPCKTCVRRHSQKDHNLVFKTKYRLMQVKSIAECLEHSAMLKTFIKLPFVIKIFVLPDLLVAVYTGLSPWLNLRFSLALTICESRALFFVSSWSVNLIKVFFHDDTLH